VKRLAKSYRPDKAGVLQPTTVTALRYPLTDPSRQPVPGGGLFPTAADVAAFGQMILNGGTYRDRRLLSEAAIRELSGTQTGELLNTG
jgi:CubicO group peptidase (beta-lactamase class C family)